MPEMCLKCEAPTQSGWELCYRCMDIMWDERICGIVEAEDFDDFIPVDEVVSCVICGGFPDDRCWVKGQTVCLTCWEERWTK